MTNNEILRRVSTAFTLSDEAVIEAFAQADMAVSAAQLAAWLTEDAAARVRMIDKELATFLNGLINLKRGKREGPQPEAEVRLSNNMVFQKLRIALNMKAEDILDVMALAGARLGKHELSAIFRRPNSKNYRACKDEVLVSFLQGVALRPGMNVSA